MRLWDCPQAVGVAISVESQGLGQTCHGVEVGPCGGHRDDDRGAWRGVRGGEGRVGTCPVVRVGVAS